MDPDDERIYLTQELEQARQELTKFRREMDGLSGQLNDMASEMVYMQYTDNYFSLSCPPNPT